MTRQKQRKVAFQLIYALNWQGLSQCENVLDTFYEQREDPERIPYIDETVKGVCAHWEELDQLIEPALANWSLKRVSAVCIAILRLAVFELKFSDQIPPRVAINEAIELAKEFGDENSGGFVHGVLSHIAGPAGE